MQEVEPRIQHAPVVEVIACSVADAIEAQRGDAHRLEVIRDFQRGGLTPPLELVRDILDAVTLPVRVMLRESENYEVTRGAEIEELCAAARRFSQLRIEGVVLGFLLNGEIDIQLTEQVLSYAPNLRATFHHAFDEAEDHFAAIRSLKEVEQVDRILTSGGAGQWPEKIERLSRYEEDARPKIKIIAGGGIDERAIRIICQATAIREFHFGRAAREPASASGFVWSERVKGLVETTRECYLSV